jgi:hypothetical protein
MVFKKNAVYSESNTKPINTKYNVADQDSWEI